MKTKFLKELSAFLKKHEAWIDGDNDGLEVFVENEKIVDCIYLDPETLDEMIKDLGD